MASHAAAHLSVPRPTKHRSIDRCGMALLRSLRRPIKTPRWWGSRHAHKQARSGHAVLHNPAAALLAAQPLTQSQDGSNSG